MLRQSNSGKFTNNAFVMALGAFAYNILLVIEQLGLLGVFLVKLSKNNPIAYTMWRRKVSQQGRKVINASNNHQKYLLPNSSLIQDVTTGFYRDSMLTLLVNIRSRTGQSKRVNGFTLILI